MLVSFTFLLYLNLKPELKKKKKKHPTFLTFITRWISFDKLHRFGKSLKDIFIRSIQVLSKVDR